MRFEFYLPLCFVAAAIFAVPNMAHRRTLFGCTVPRDFHSSPTGRRSIAEFRFAVAIAFAAALLALAFVPRSFLSPVLVAGPVFVICIGILMFLREHRRVAPFAFSPVHPREAEVSTAPEKLPGFVWFAAGPFAILAAAAVFLHLHWSEIPSRFPVHWGLDGQPNRWDDRSVQGVYGPLFVAAAFCALLLICGLTTWFGARRSHLRRVTLASMIAVEYMLALSLAAVAMKTFIQVPVSVMTLVPLIFLVPVAVAAARASTEPGDGPEITPDEAWKGGMIYYNPDDPALFVPKRFGLGYSLNYANRWSWLFLGGIVLIVVVAPLLK